jgi:type I thyroxine 5'-deiodinase
VEFYVVYIREAHPSDGTGRVSARNEREGVKVGTAKTEKERAEMGKTCSAELDLPMPFLMDTMDDATAKAYAALPDRFYLIGQDGKVVFRTAQAGKCKASDLETALKDYLKANPEAGKATDPVEEEAKLMEDDKTR